jgi:hypothetical protein
VQDIHPSPSDAWRQDRERAPGAWLDAGLGPDMRDPCPSPLHAPVLAQAAARSCAAADAAPVTGLRLTRQSRRAGRRRTGCGPRARRAATAPGGTRRLARSSPSQGTARAGLARGDAAERRPSSTTSSPGSRPRRTPSASACSGTPATGSPRARRATAGRLGRRTVASAIRGRARRAPRVPPRWSKFMPATRGRVESLRARATTAVSNQIRAQPKPMGKPPAGRPLARILSRMTDRDCTVSHRRRTPTQADPHEGARGHAAEGPLEPA